MIITAKIVTRSREVEEDLLDALEDLIHDGEIEGFTVNVRSWRWTRRAHRLGGVLLLLGLAAASWALLWMLAPVQ